LIAVSSNKSNKVLSDYSTGISEMNGSNEEGEGREELGSLYSMVSLYISMKWYSSSLLPSGDMFQDSPADT
jgi:hypothetical protein